MPSLTDTRARAGAICIAVLVMAVVASAAFYPRHSLSHDASWYLISTRMFVDGAQLYSDIVEINPPLAFYESVPAILLTDWTSWDATKAYFYYCIALAAMSSLWCFRLVYLARLSSQWSIVLVCTAIAALFLAPISEFGQREHLLLIFAMPYLVYIAFFERLRDLSLFEESIIGLFGFFGFALKPYFLAIPVSAVLARSIRSRDLSVTFCVANLTLAALLVAYVVFIYLQHPLYIEKIVPAARLVYQSFGVDSASVWLRTEILAFAILSVALLANWRKSSLATIALWGAAAGAVISYLTQFKGWNYQILPAAVLVFMTSFAIAKDYAKHRKPAFLGTGLVLGIAFLTVGHQLIRGPYQSATSKEFGEYVPRPGMKILVLSTNVSASFPFVNEVSGRWTSGYSAQWLIPGALARLTGPECAGRAESCPDVRAVLAMAREDMANDVSEGKPDIVFIDDRKRKSYFGGRQFDYLDFLRESPAFAASWTCYRQVGGAIDYQVWKRVCK